MQTSNPLPFVTGSKGQFLRRIDYIVMAIYAAFTVALTYPLPLHLGTSGRDWGDPFLNAWIMAWQLDRVAALDFVGYFDTNVFFPHLNTLAYSEFLVPQIIATAPIYYLAGNAILAHNVAMLLAFVASAWCAYLLARHLTGSTAGGFVAGVVFAFNPFMFDHLSHLQVITAAGIPLSFFFLHRYFETDEVRYVGLFSLTYSAQALANAYFAVYLTYAAAAFILYRAWGRRMLLRTSFWAHMAAHVVISTVLLAPFYAQYLRLRTDMGFTRDMAEVWGNPFLATPAINRLYGPLTINWSSPEAKLFPGFIAAALVFAGVGWVLWDRAPVLRAPRRAPRSELAYRALGWLALAMAMLVIAIATYGGFRTTFVGLDVSSTHVDNPLAVLFACLVARAVLRRRHDGLRLLARSAFSHEVFYVGLLVAGVVLSMGAGGPYRLLFEYAPGFNAIRAVPRIHVLTMFAAAMLAAMAVHRLRSQLVWAARPAVMVALVGAICAEYVSIPVPLFSPGAPPAVDGWLARQPGDFAVIHYPIDRERETLRMYRSLSHGKKVVNGLSGFPAPVYNALGEREFPGLGNVDDLEDLGVRYVIVDQTYYHDRAIQIRQQLRKVEPRLLRVAELGDHLVYELAAPWSTREEVRARLLNVVSASSPLPRDDWSVSVNDNPWEAELAIDGDPETRWRTRVQRAGISITIDIGSRRPIAGVSMSLGAWQRDYPRGWRVDVSDDGVDWRTVWAKPRYQIPITSFLDPKNLRVEARFDPVEARHVRATITVPAPDVVWSVTEIEVLAPPLS